VPHEIEQPIAAATISLKAKTVASDTRVRKAMFTLVIASVAMLVLGAIALKKGDASWNLPLLFFAASLFSLFRYLRVRKTVAQELQRAGEDVPNAQ
jgi:hypothetical protein